MSFAERRKFFAWLRKSPENVAEIFRAIDVEAALNRHKLAEMLDTGHHSNVIDLGFLIDPSQHYQHAVTGEPLEEERKKVMIKTPMTLSWKLVAMVGVVTLTILLAFGVEDLWIDHTVSTTADQRQDVTLDDGSIIYAGERTQVKVDFRDDRRLVRLSKGEAMFDVAKDTRRPFTVRTKLIDVTAVGTKFSMSIDSGVRVTVSEGIVKAVARGDTGNEEVVMLKAGEELLVSGSYRSKPVFSKIDVSGSLEFHGTTIGEAVAEFNRRNVIQIRIEHPSIAQRRLVGYYRYKVDSPEEFARAVGQLSGIALTEDRANKVLRFHLSGAP